MRPSAVLINVARGPIVDEDALFEALRERTIGGAVLDTWYRYPERAASHASPLAPSVPRARQRGHDAALLGLDRGRDGAPLRRDRRQPRAPAAGRPLLNQVHPARG